MDQRGDGVRPVRQGFAAAAQDVFARRGVDDGAGRDVGDEGEVRGRRKNGCQQSARLGGFQLGHRKVGDVQVRASHPLRRPVRAELHIQVHPQVPDTAVRPGDPVRR